MQTENRDRYRALVECVQEQIINGQNPNPFWLEEISTTRARHPDWIDAPMPPTIVQVPVYPSTLPPPPPPGANAPRAAASKLSPGRVPITIDNNVERVIDEVLQVWGDRLRVFQSSGRLVELQTDKGKDLQFLVRELQSPRMVPITTNRAWKLAADTCSFGKEIRAKDGTPERKEELPPDWIGRSIISLPEFPHIPSLGALAVAPTLRPDGALIWEPGYDASTGILLASDLKVSIPENPTMEDARLALTELLDPVSEFDFVNESGKTAWLSGLLSVVCRHTFEGPAPIFIVDASKRGSGKTTLADLASVIATGTQAPKMIYTADEIEMDKRICSLGLAGDAMVLIDNIVGKLASPSLDGALTSTTYQGRLLGKSEMATVTMKIVWWATGNGIIIGQDIGRRALTIRLEPQCDRPEQRTGPRPGTVWKYPDVLRYARQNRSRLLGHALTIVSAYIRAGRPALQLPPMGSFDDWSATIRSAIVWAGGADPYITIKETQAADLDDLALRTMVECWPVADGVEVTAATLLDWAVTTPPMALEPAKRDAFERTRTMREMWRNALLEWLPAKKGDLPTAREIGYGLRNLAGSIVEGFKIEAGKHTKSGIPWKRLNMRGDSAVPAIETNEEKPSLFSIIK